MPWLPLPHWTGTGLRLRLVDEACAPPPVPPFGNRLQGEDWARKYRMYMYRGHDLQRFPLGTEIEGL